MATSISATRLTAKVWSTAKKALLVIDVQENLLRPDARLHIDSEATPSFLEQLNRTIRFCTHNNIPALYTINEWTNPILNALTGNVCKKDAPGTGLDPRVQIVGNAIYRKSKNNALSNKDLLAYLKKNGITELYITGLFSEACIQATSKSAIKQGFRVSVIEDAVGSRSHSKKLRSLKQCHSKGAVLLKTHELVSLLSSTQAVG